MMKTEQQHPMTPHEEGECASPGLPTVASAAAAAAAVAAALRTPQMHQNATHMAHGSNMPVQVRMNIYYSNLYCIRCVFETRQIFLSFSHLPFPTFS